MKTNIKVGDTFDVVEVLNLGGFTRDDIKQGGWTVGLSICGPTSRLIGYHILANGPSPIVEKLYMSLKKREIKPVGRLVITKIK